MNMKVIDHIMAYTQQESIKRFSRNRSLIDNLSDVLNHISDNIRIIHREKRYRNKRKIREENI